MTDRTAITITGCKTHAERMALINAEVAAFAQRDMHMVRAKMYISDGEFCADLEFMEDKE